MAEQLWQVLLHATEDESALSGPSSGSEIALKISEGDHVNCRSAWLGFGMTYFGEVAALLCLADSLSLTAGVAISVLALMRYFIIRRAVILDSASGSIELRRQLLSVRDHLEGIALMVGLGVASIAFNEWNNGRPVRAWIVIGPVALVVYVISLWHSVRLLASRSSREELVKSSSWPGENKDRMGPPRGR